MAWVDIVNFLKSIGIVPEAIVPLVILSLIVCIIFFKKLSKCLDPISNAIIEIQGIFTSWKFPLKYSLTETRGSPLKPTAWGWKLIKESELDKILKDNKRKFLDELDDKLKETPPITAYDVQEKARGLLIGYKNEEIMSQVKLYAFKIGIDVEIILRTGGLVLRDEYLKDHPKITKK